jgi:hypothetical protein
MKQVLRLIVAGWRLRALHYPTESKTHRLERISDTIEDMIRHWQDQEKAE